jgi:hypothetical protein
MIVYNYLNVYQNDKSSKNIYQKVKQTYFNKSKIRRIY